jgi:methylthioribose-1-phosphate isomerase
MGQRADYNMPFLLQYENVAWYEEGKVRILDRRMFNSYWGSSGYY